MSYDILFEELIRKIKEQIFEKAAMFAPDFRGGCAIGYETDGEITIVTRKINENLPDYWEGNGQYALYAGYKCATALEKRYNTVDLDGGCPIWVGASDRGGCFLYLEPWDINVAIGFSGLTSEEDELIAKKLLGDFFQNEE